MDRPQLPLLAAHSGTNRDAMTCLYRCGNACNHPAPNTSDNEYFGTEVSRRGIFKTAAGAAGAIVIGSAAAATVGPALAFAADPATPVVPEADGFVATSASAPTELTFKPIPPNLIDTVVVPNGYDHSVIIKWGDPVERDAPAFDVSNQSAAAQAKQFGYNNDFVAVLPLDSKNKRALLVCNHEYTNEELMFHNYAGPDSLTVEQIQVAMAAHGMSVVELERIDDSGQWRVASDRRGLHYNRRITTSGTKFELTGPAAGSVFLRTAADPAGRVVIGTQNNCAGGVTPWGTVLSGEENFNQYFVGGNAAPDALKPSMKRYGVDIANRYPAGNRKWDRADARFDVAAHPNEFHRFGWIVEIDPFDPESTPRKHTAMGRFKHEGANIILARDGRAVAYMGDDERFDYMYKFVSDKKFDAGKSARARKNNLSLLESGTLYVAKFDFTSATEIDGSGKLPADGMFNGTGRWIPLVKGGQSCVEGMSVEEVLVFTRLAGDKVGATKMDRPEDVEPNLRTGKIYAALTNNTNRGKAGFPGPDEVNPRTNNKFGHILEITEAGDDNTAETFTWCLPIICGDPNDPSTYFMGFDKTKVSPIACPDNVAFDGAGNLWIASDQLYALPNQNDGLFVVPLEGPDKGHLRQFLSVPYGAETCGPFIYQDNRTVFTAIQHPGEITGASIDKPASTWPDGDFAKPAIINTWRKDGRAIGL
ncbi:PhoX family phosphatase [Longispora sp. K20-0274]|uniref:PhoX family protein n=1 Tax=Longispora sp. K20-0274 TaxID=3088255 RepID=UPI003999A5C4